MRRILMSLVANFKNALSRGLTQGIHPIKSLEGAANLIELERNQRDSTSLH